MVELMLLVLWLALSALGQVFHQVKANSFTTDDLLGWAWFLALVVLLVVNDVFQPLS